MEALEGSVADCLLPCTASEKETCQIVTKLVTLKKVLLGSPFEIQEEPETYNQLSITNLTLITPPLQDMDSRHIQEYSELLEWLLTTHRCIGVIVFEEPTTKGPVYQ
ncbi:hypothetical protein HPB52_014396 [Rhipicephalus sanguineus]|uniref:Uncharacterized protein n=1 Tax=Rhipicephalus sanguineus TaxID=34632 RepID=A0A9D4T7V6_RHISA|nr:hypothetical protein HPB52_014396 [Rhipicephalus sanguineus]